MCENRNWLPFRTCIRKQLYYLFDLLAFRIDCSIIINTLIVLYLYSVVPEICSNFLSKINPPKNCKKLHEVESKVAAGNFTCRILAFWIESGKLTNVQKDTGLDTNNSYTLLYKSTHIDVYLYSQNS